MLRVVGSLVFGLRSRSRSGWRCAVRIHSSRPGGVALLGPALAGGVAELIKLAVRRERPGFADGEYVFRGFAERTWSTSGLGFPTSHGMVALGGAAVLARLFPAPRRWPMRSRPGAPSPASWRGPTLPAMRWAGHLRMGHRRVALAPVWRHPHSERQDMMRKLFSIVFLAATACEAGLRRPGPKTCGVPG